MIARRLIDSALSQSVLVDTAFVALCLSGVFALSQMPVEEYPNVSFDQVKVVVPFPGASPEDVESLVVRKLEDAVLEIEDVEYIRAEAHPDRAEMLIKFRDGTDIDSREREVQNEVSAISDLPEGTDRALVFTIDIEEVNPVLHVILGGDLPEAVLAHAARDLRDELVDVEGVAKVKDWGIRQAELSVLCDPAQLAHEGITVGDVAAAISASGQNVPAGLLETPTGDFLVRASGEFENALNVANVAVRQDPDGSFVRVSSLARLERGFERAYTKARYKGKSAVSLSVVKRVDANALDIVDMVHERSRTFMANRAPEGMTLEFVADTTKRVRKRTSLLLENIELGLVLVCASLWLFIGLRNALLAVVGIPFSFLVTFVFMHWAGESINSVSLFSLVLVLGVVVDDAIVILENIHRHLEAGSPLREAIVDGCSEVVSPVTASTLTTVVAFLPLLLMTGPMGRFFSIIPITVAYALGASLLEAFIILPVHMLHLHRRGGTQQGGNQQGGNRLTKLRSLASTGGWLLARYERLLQGCLRRPWVTLAVTLAIGIGSAGALTRVPVHLFPSEYQQFFVNVKLPPGTPLSKTQEVTDRVDAVIWSLAPELVDNTFVTLGLFFDWNYRPKRASHYAQVLVTSSSTKHQTGSTSTKRVMERVRQALSAVDLGRATVEIVELSEGPPMGRPISVRVRGDDLGVLTRISRTIMSEIEALPGTKDVQSDLQLGHESVSARLRADRAGLHGLRLRDVATALQNAVEGRVACSFREIDEEVDVRVRLDPKALATPADLARVKLRNRHGELVELADVARLDITRGPLAINRFDRRRAVTITADIDPTITSSTEAVTAIRSQLEGTLPHRSRVGYRLEWEGEFEETNRSFASLRQAFAIAMLLLYGLLAAQFRSAVMPFVVLLTVPFSFVGVVVGVYISGDPFTIATFIAIIGLSGMVVNDSLVLLEFYRLNRAAGLDPRESLQDAGNKRLRPVLLTTLTTVLGLAPMAIGLGGRSLLWGPMATALVFGMTFATGLTLLVIPTAVLIMERFRRTEIQPAD